MKELPENLDKIIETADRELQNEEIPPHARPIHCVMKVAKALKIQRLPLVPLSQNDPEKDCLADLITQRISSWYREFYGERLNLDPSANARIAIIADGDIWEGNLPIIFGGLIAPSKNLNLGNDEDGNGPFIYNPCAHLTGITQARLNRFTHEDMNEVVDLFNLGWNAREALNRFRKSDPLFNRAESDWAAATRHLTAQRPDYGQSLYSSYQLTEKFMKAIISILSQKPPPRIHDLKMLLEELKTVCRIQGVESLEPLISKIPYRSSARYEAAITREDAYTAYKSSLQLVGELGTVG